MPFMELDVTERTDWYEIDGNNGTTVVPVDAIGNISVKDKEAFKDYYEGSHIDSVTIVRNQYGAHYTAPGYMDQTEWTIGNNKRNLIREVRSMYEE